MRDMTPRRTIQSGQSGASRRETLLKRVLLWGILALSGVMVIIVLGAAAARSNAEAQVAAAQAQNAALQRTIAQTTQAIATAKSDDEIERAARRWGYVRSGDQPVIIVGSSTK